MKYEKISYKYRLLERESWILDLAETYAGEYLTLNAGMLTIKAGYMWDGPSGPTVDTENFMRASCVHDALYQLIREGVLPLKPHRKRADKLLLKICKEDGMGLIRRHYVYQAVRWFGYEAAR